MTRVLDKAESGLGAGVGRRSVLKGLAWAVAGGAAIMTAVPMPAAALDADGARSHVQGTIDEVLQLVQQPGAAASKAPSFQAILEKRAAMPQIARFAAGPLWREMSDSQQGEYAKAFARYVATVYAARFQEYSGQAVKLGSVSDLGRRGLSVASTVAGSGQSPVAVNWVVTDRPGRTVISDIVIEGVSMLITQREEIAGISKREGGIDGLIAYLKSV